MEGVYSASAGLGGLQTPVSGAPRRKRANAIPREFRMKPPHTGTFHGLHWCCIKGRASEHAKGEQRKMKNFIRGIMIVAALAGTVSLSAQTADEIIWKICGGHRRQRRDSAR